MSSTLLALLGTYHAMDSPLLLDSNYGNKKIHNTLITCQYKFMNMLKLIRSISYSLQVLQQWRDLNKFNAIHADKTQVKIRYAIFDA